MPNLFLVHYPSEQRQLRELWGSDAQVGGNWGLGGTGQREELRSAEELIDLQASGKGSVAPPTVMRYLLSSVKIWAVFNFRWERQYIHLKHRLLQSSRALIALLWSLPAHIPFPSNVLLWQLRSALLLLPHRLLMSIFVKKFKTESPNRWETLYSTGLLKSDIFQPFNVQSSSVFSVMFALETYWRKYSFAFHILKQRLLCYFPHFKYKCIKPFSPVKANRSADSSSIPLLMWPLTPRAPHAVVILPETCHFRKQLSSSGTVIWDYWGTFTHFHTFWKCRQLPCQCFQRVQGLSSFPAPVQPQWQPEVKEQMFLYQYWKRDFFCILSMILVHNMPHYPNKNIMAEE